MSNDTELLRRYVEERSESAFSELVQEHLNLVYSAALREMGANRPLVEDLSQAVFTELARKAPRLQGHPSLAGWLYTTVRHMAANLRRAEQHRRHREEEAQTMSELLSENSPNEAWEQLRPVLDDALHALNAADREAVVLRFLEGRALREVGARLGLSENAARMRVERALDKLRGLLARRGITSTASGLAAALAVGALTPAPSALAATVASAALTSGAAAATGSTTLTLMHIMNTSKITAGLIGALVAAGIAVPVWQQTRLRRVQSENAHLRAQQTEVAALRSEVERLRQVKADQAELERLRQYQALTEPELLKLRGEVTRRRLDSKELEALRSGTLNDQKVQFVNAWLERVNQLKQRLQEHPEASIPELQGLSQADWLSATQRELDSEQAVRRALSQLRHAAESKYLQQMLPGLIKYAQEHGGQPPTDLLQVKACFNPPIEDAILQRYEILPADKLPLVHTDMDGWVVTQKAAVDLECDYRTAAGPGGWVSGSFEESEMIATLLPALKAYCSANSGNMPMEAAQIEPYLSTPQERAALEKAAKMFAAEEPEHRARDLRDLQRLLR